MSHVTAENNVEFHLKILLTICAMVKSRTKICMLLKIKLKIFFLFSSTIQTYTFNLFLNTHQNRNTKTIIYYLNQR